MHAKDFTQIAEHTLSLIAQTIEEQDPEGLIEVDFDSDMLNLTTSRGIYIINKHSVAQEIWLASPVSGPYHFFYTGGFWQSKSQFDLLEVLAAELKIVFEFKELGNGI